MDKYPVRVCLKVGLAKLIYSDRNQTSEYTGGWELTANGMSEFFVLMEMFSTLVGELVTWVYALLKLIQVYAKMDEI